jgi:hypothetical protein
MSGASRDGEYERRRRERRIATGNVANADIPSPYRELWRPPVRVGLLMRGKAVSRAVQVLLRQQSVQPRREPPVGVAEQFHARGHQHEAHQRQSTPGFRDQFSNITRVSSGICWSAADMRLAAS